VPEGATADDPESLHLRNILDRLAARFSPPLSGDEVERCLLEAVASFRDAPVRTYMAVLIERAATDLLQTAVRAGGPIAAPAPPPDVHMTWSQEHEPVPVGGE
jgi:hypothetical protein